MKLLSSLTLGFARPRISVLGMDAAGTVEMVGSSVTAFSPGDEVIAMLGARFGGHAQYVTVAADQPIVAKPTDLDFEAAVALVFGGITAQAFLERAVPLAGASVLVNGASGAVGTAAVQLAVIAGAHVTGVCSARNAALVRSLGAERVVDYEQTDITSEGEKFDVIVDCVGNLGFDRVEPIIAPGGTLLSVISDLAGIVLARGRSKRSGKTVVAGNVPFTPAQLTHVAGLAESKRFRPVIDSTFDLADIAAAHRHVDTGHKTGSVVVRVPAKAADDSAAGLPDHP